MNVVIDFDSWEPPAGHIATLSGELRFEGWLELLRLLEKLASGGDERTW